MIPYLKKQGDATVLMVEGRPFVMLAGEIHNSAASSPAWMEREVWPRVDELGLNTLLAPVTWELTEPEEGRFDFSGVDALLAQARAHGKRLGLLWFGAWKNAQCYYAPAWVKADLARFRRAEMEKGQRKIALKEFYNMPYTTLSAFCPETCRADARAFAALMAHLRSVDGGQNTVVTVQVENETGFMGAAREHSDEADAAFAAQVPPGLVESLLATEQTLAPDVGAALRGGARAGSWQQVFGPVAEEMFTAYHTARYVNAVAKAGKAEYPLPMTVNCWLDKGHKPGRFPSGGPVARVMEIWRFAAPEIDIVAPDIYVPAFCDVCDGYRKLGNPLFIPEAASHAYAGPRLLYAVGHHHAVCYSPFGIEELGQPFGAQAGVLFGMDTTDPALRTPQDPAEYAALNRALAGLMPVIGPRLGTAAVQAASSERPGEMLRFDRAGFAVRFAENCPGACLAVQVGPQEFYLLALHCSVDACSLDAAAPHLDLLCLEDGCFDAAGAWQPGRRLNGDEVALMDYGAPTLLHARVLLYD